MNLEQFVLFKKLKKLYKKHFTIIKSDWSPEKRIKKNMDLYHANMGYKFDINNPVLFTEKIQWYKEFYNTNELKYIVDKVHFKEYIENKIGKGNTIPLYGYWVDLESLLFDWEKLPQSFVLKSNCQSDGRFIKVISNKDKIDLNELSKELVEWFDPKNTLINSFCSAYHKCTPCVLAEEYVEQIGNQLYDYKFFCFNGKVECIYVATNHFTDDWYPISFYDLNWNRLDVRYGKHKTGNEEKPVHLDEMISISKQLSEGFPFVRVDFFDTNEKLYVAELTFYPGGGMTPYYPESFNKYLGDLFLLPLKSLRN